MFNINVNTSFHSATELGIAFLIRSTLRIGMQRRDDKPSEMKNSHVKADVSSWSVSASTFYIYRRQQQNSSGGSSVNGAFRADKPKRLKRKTNEKRVKIRKFGTVIGNGYTEKRRYEPRPQSSKNGRIYVE